MGYRQLPSSSTSTSNVARALGWFSLALGAVELAAPGALARAIGARDDADTRKTLRVFGARECVAGLAILMQPDRSQWLWSRVGGDALDLAWLGRRMADEGASRERLGLATAAVAGVTALDVATARQLSRVSPVQGRAVKVEQVVTIACPADELYRYWRDFANFPRFMRHLNRVEVLDARRSRWTATAPAGMSVTWDAEIVQDRDGEWLAWRSLPDSQVQNRGSVRFTPAPGARGTEVRVQLEYEPPAGQLGRMVAMLFGEEPEQQVREDLRRFKQLMETGEIPLSDGPGLWRAAQPAAHAEQIREHAGVTE